MTKQCEIGIAEKVLKAAIADWKKRQPKKRALPRSLAGYPDFIASLPAPPVYGSADYYRCMSKWYAAYMQAQQMNSWVTQIAQLQANISQGIPILDALVGAYTDCMEGTPV